MSRRACVRSRRVPSITCASRFRGRCCWRACARRLRAGERLSRKFERMHDASTLLGALTRREREVLRLAVDGMANKVIARRLGISHRTVEIHKARITRRRRQSARSGAPRRGVPRVLAD